MRVRVAIINGVSRTEAPQESSWAEDTIARLHAEGHRKGGARLAIIELLGREPCCLTAMEIFDKLRGEGKHVGIASVYRVLDLLVEHRVVQRVDVGGGHLRYEPRHRSGEHHHHIVCDDCGSVEAFSDPKLERVLHQIEDSVGYTIFGHEVVLHGECGDCKATTPPRTTSQ
jgi:Fur family ferric uptake transcriptional regulator